MELQIMRPTLPAFRVVGAVALAATGFLVLASPLAHADNWHGRGGWHGGGGGRGGWNGLARQELGLARRGLHRGGPAVYIPPRVFYPLLCAASSLLSAAILLPRPMGMPIPDTDLAPNRSAASNAATRLPVRDLAISGGSGRHCHHPGDDAALSSRHAALCRARGLHAMHLPAGAERRFGRQRSKGDARG